MEETLHTLLPEYLQDQLSDDDRRAIRARSASDPAFAAELGFQKKAAQAIRDAEYLRMKKILRDEDALLNRPAKNAEATPRIVPLDSWKRWAAAAAVMALAFSGWWLFMRETPEKMFAAAFRPYDNILANEYGLTEREEAKATTDVERAFLQLKNKKYAAAAADFAGLTDSKNDPRFRFWQAQALAADDRAKEAVGLLKPFADDPKSTLYGPAHWYTALAYLRAGDVPNARNWLEKVVADPLIFERKTEAVALLEKLK